ncbi:MAG: class A beta-lactamase [Candidatus Acidiferrum sp.]
MRLSLLLLFFSISANAQTSLQQEVRRIAADAHGKVSVACSMPHSTFNCDLDPHAHPPMQSVFKLPLALTALHLVEQGRFPLDQPMNFFLGDRILPYTYSPLQDKYPEAGVEVPLQELLRLSTSLSDNVAADMVLQLVGGPSAVNSYMASIGVTGFHMESSEHALHYDPTAQYRNWFEPAGAVEMLRLISDGSALTPEHTQLLLKWMRDTPHGAHQLKGNLPAKTIVMHKTGSSGTVNGMTAVTNDIGLITLPDGRRMAIAVFMTDSSADDATRDGVIARIAKAAYDEALLEQ